jgi:hypothetical protein
VGREFTLKEEQDDIVNAKMGGGEKQNNFYIGFSSSQP